MDTEPWIGRFRNGDFTCRGPVNAVVRFLAHLYERPHHVQVRVRCVIAVAVFGCCPQECAAAEAIIDVFPLTMNADWEVAPDNSGFVVTSMDGQPAEFVIAITSNAGLTTAHVTVSNDGSFIDSDGDSGYQPAAPLVLERGSQVAYVMALTNSGNTAATTSSYASDSWLDNYSNWFNSTFGSGWSNAAGGVIHSGLTTVIDLSTLANASDGAILTGTVIASVPVAVGTLYGGEVLLGVGTFGGTAGTAATAGTVATGATATTIGAEAAATIGTQAVVVGPLGAGTYPALVVNGTVYVARFHVLAWEAAGKGVEIFYGLATIDAAGKVINLAK